MAERRKSKGNEEEEGTDGSKQKGGTEGKFDHQVKRKRLGGAAHFVHKRVTEQSSKKKGRKSDSSEPRFDTPPSDTHSEGPQRWASWQKPPRKPPNAPESTDPVQQIHVASASGAVIPSTEETQSDDIVLPTEGATPPTPMKHDDDDDTNITTDANMPSFVPEPVVPQQSSDDVELSLKLARIEIENGRHKRELKDKERQIREYEDEIVLLRTQMSRSGGGGGGVLLDQSAKLTSTIQQLEMEKEELMKGKEELTKEKEELTKEKEELEEKLTAENGELIQLKKEKEELLTKNKELKDGMEQERERLRKGTEEKVAEEKTKLEQENDQLKVKLMAEETLKEKLKEELTKKEEELKKKEEELKEEFKKDKEELTKEKEKLIEEKDEFKETLTKEKEEQMLEKETLARELKEKLAKEEELNEQFMKEKKELMMEKEALKKELMMEEGLLKELEEEKWKLVEEVEDRITDLTKSLEKEKEERRKAEGHMTEFMKKHAIELEGIKQQLDTQIAEKNHLMMNYLAQIKQLEEEMDEKMKQLHEETVRKMKQHKEATAKAQDREGEAVLKELDDLRNQVKMRTEDIETLEKDLKAQREEAEIKNDAYKKLEAQLKEREEEIEAHVNERLREEVDKHLREAVKAQLTSQKIDEQRKVFAAHLKEKEEKVKTQYEVLLASKDRCIKELGAELEETMEQLKQKEEVEHNLREELANLQLKVEAGDGASANKSLSEEDKMKRELEDHITRVKELEEMISKLEKDKREVEQNLRAEVEIQIKDKDEEIQKLKGQVQNGSLLSLELRKLLETNEKQLADTKKNIDELEDELSNKVVEIEDLKDSLSEKEGEIIRLTEESKKNTQIAAEEKKQTVKQLKGEVDDLVKKFNTQERKIKAENAVYKLDFESERNDRQRIHAEYEELKTKTEEFRMQHKADMVAMAKKLHDCEEEIQELTAQVNAYSCEIDKQKGLVTQSQEKHKTEVNELNKKLANEMKSQQNLVNELEKKLANTKQQLVDELTIMKEQLHRAASANKDSLLKSDQQLDNKLDEMRQQFSIYSCQKQEIEQLRDEIKVFQRSKQELEDQLSSKQEEVTSFHKMLSGFQSCWEVSHENVSLSKKDLGRGAWGVVLMGQLRIAVKQLHQAIENPHYLEILYREIDIMSQIRHPNLLQFIGAVLDHPSGYPLIITEIMDTSLRKAYESKELTPDPACRPMILSIMHDVAQGLNYLHCLPDPIIHRDVSSANVLLQSMGPKKWKAKVSDFGSANLAHKSNTRAPGAAAYSAPEVLQSITSFDSKKQTTKMDVFSYGILLCEIITCRFPDMDFFQDILSQVKSISTRPRCNRYTQGILLRSLIDLCINDDPRKRPTMNQIMEKLDAI